jgi:hypothetical protein
MARNQDLVRPQGPLPTLVRQGRTDLVLMPKFMHNTVEKILLLLMVVFGSVQGPLGTVQGPRGWVCPGTPSHYGKFNWLHLSSASIRQPCQPVVLYNTLLIWSSLWEALFGFGSVQGPLGTVQGPLGWVCPGTPRFGLSRDLGSVQGPLASRLSNLEFRQPYQPDVSDIKLVIGSSLWEDVYASRLSSLEIRKTCQPDGSDNRWMTGISFWFDRYASRLSCSVGLGSVQGPLVLVDVGTAQGPHAWVCPGTPRSGLSRDLGSVQGPHAILGKE